MSLDSRGYYCHFDIDIFSRKSINPDFIAGLAFLQFNGNPLVKVDDDAKKYLTGILGRVTTEYIKKEKSNNDIMAANLLAVFTEVNQFYKSEPKTENAAARITQQYKNQLSLHIYERKPVAG